MNVCQQDFFTPSISPRDLLFTSCNSTSNYTLVKTACWETTYFLNRREEGKMVFACGNLSKKLFLDNKKNNIKVQQQCHHKEIGNGWNEMKWQKQQTQLLKLKIQLASLFLDHDSGIQMTFLLCISILHLSYEL